MILTFPDNSSLDLLETLLIPCLLTRKAHDYFEYDGGVFRCDIYLNT